MKISSEANTAAMAIAAIIPSDYQGHHEIGDTKWGILTKAIQTAIDQSLANRDAVLCEVAKSLDRIISQGEGRKKILWDRIPNNVETERWSGQERTWASKAELIEEMLVEIRAARAALEGK